VAHLQVAPNSAAWSGWSSFGGYVKQIAVGRNLDRRLEVFAINSINGVSNIWQLTGGGWSGWNNGLGGFVKQIAIGNDADGRLDLFAVNAINGVSHVAQVVPNGNWAAGTTASAGSSGRSRSAATPTAGWTCSPSAPTTPSGTSTRRPRTAASGPLVRPGRLRLLDRRRQRLRRADRAVRRHRPRHPVPPLAGGPQRRLEQHPGPDPVTSGNGSRG